MAAKSQEERIDRLEQVVQVIAEGQLSLEKLIADLATETRRGFDQVAEQMRETDKQMRETDRQMRETDRKMGELARRTDERFSQTDERIGKLVIAIGAFMNQKN
jgi:methyl-accepting chemotaxis protein